MTYQADQLQIIPAEIGATGKSFWTLATQERLTLTFFNFARSNHICNFSIQVGSYQMMLLYPNDNLGAIQLVAPTFE